jgi:hypothetical protein
MKCSSKGSALFFLMSALSAIGCSDSSDTGADLYGSEYDDLYDDAKVAGRYSTTGDPVPLEGFWYRSPKEESHGKGTLSIRLKIDSSSMMSTARCTVDKAVQKASAKNQISIAADQRKINIQNDASYALENCDIKFNAKSGSSLDYSILGRDLNLAGERFVKVAELKDDPQAKKNNTAASPTPTPGAKPTPTVAPLAANVTLANSKWGIKDRMTWSFSSNQLAVSLPCSEDKPENLATGSAPIVIQDQGGHGTFTVEQDLVVSGPSCEGSPILFQAGEAVEFQIVGSPPVLHFGSGEKQGELSRL